MNRIRKVGNIWQVLITPSYVSSPSMEIMLGNWTDEKLRGFQVIETDNQQDAMDIAFSLPDINWNKLVNIHVDAFQSLSKAIQRILKTHHVIADVYPKLQTPLSLKNTIFDRVLIKGGRFTLRHEANDIISIDIVNPWSKNIEEISSIIQSYEELKIISKINSKSITLIGKTIFGTSYEIRLWTTIQYQLAVWLSENPTTQTEIKNMWNAVSSTQKVVDSGIIIR